jgi:tetratricopeptide (TPR) repeat protein
VRRITASLMKWGFGVAALAACCAGGVAVSSFLRTAERPLAAESAEGGGEADGGTSEPVAKEEEGAVNAQENGSDPAHFDRLLLDARLAEAVAAADVLREKTSGAARDALDYRVALCQEILGRPNEAQEGYTALATRCPDSPAGLAAVAGQARIWLHDGKADLARRKLAALLLRTGRPPLRGHSALGDVPELLAVAMAREVCGNETAGPLSLSPTHPAVEAAVPPMVAAVKWEVPAAVAEPPAASATLQKTGSRPESWTVTATARQMAATDFLNDVAKQAGAVADWSTEARKQAAARTLTVSVERVPLLELLRHAAAAADLGWELAEGKLTLSVLSADSTPARKAAVRQALLEAITAYPDHVLAPVVAVELGNIEMSNGKLKEAAGWYERMIRERPRTATVTEAYFNLGLVRARTGERGLARDAFFRVVDRAPTGPLAPLAHLHIGRLYLEEANAALAARALRRVEARETNAVARTRAALLLAAAELFDDNPRAAHAAIADVRRNIEEAPFVRPAALLDALSRYRATTDPSRHERAAGDLLAALLAYREEPLLASIGLVLVGQAYRDLALGEEMAAAYQKAMPAVGAAVALSMKADLAEYLLATGKKGAAPLLREVAAAPGPRAARAELHLAEIALRQKRPDECLTRCRKTLATGDAATSGEAVRLMGQAYTQKGDHAAAARCFAGRPPVAEGAGEAVTQQ